METKNRKINVKIFLILFIAALIGITIILYILSDKGITTQIYSPSKSEDISPNSGWWIFFKMEKRIRYTDEEIYSFLNGLDDDDKFSVTLKLIFTTIYTLISKNDIIDIFKKEKGENVELGVFSIDLMGFLFEVSLKDVPLYLNSFPDFAKWRLRIGK